MFNQDLLARLSQLNRQQASAPAAPGPTAAPAATAAGLLCPDAEDEDVSQLPRGEVVENRWGRHWVRQRRISQLWPHGDAWLRHALVRLDQCRANPPTRSRELSALWQFLPCQVLYLDLETCGFAGSMVFLIGLIHRQGDQFLLTQLMARDYAEEKSMLQALWTIAAQNKVLATFNGKSFDWPMVHDRSTIHHLGCALSAAPAPAGERATSAASHPSVQQAESAELSAHDPRPELIHCDLLHHARRRWKDQLPNCKLQTLERVVCQRHRHDDIPGREIPAAYHDFVRTGDAWLMRSVLHHNALDLITLLQLSMLLVHA